MRWTTAFILGVSWYVREFHTSSLSIVVPIVASWCRPLRWHQFIVISDFLTQILLFLQGEDGGLSSAAILTSRTSAAGWSYQAAIDKIEMEKPAANAPRLDISSLIAAKRKSLTLPNSRSDENDASSNRDEAQGSEEDDHDDDSDCHSDSSSASSAIANDNDEIGDSLRDEEDILKTRAGSEMADKSSSADREEAAKAAAFFDDDPSHNAPVVESFHQLALSRPILRGVAAMGFVQPTPIQSAVIPLALAGRDICASAVTGSGKSAAFLLPILERLLHRPSNSIKALILTPTRELAAQCLAMMATLAQFTKLRASLIVGGSKNLNAQAAELKSRPDLVVATPGRILDHVMNTPGVTLVDVSLLVLDEADRLLDLGFQDEVKELIKQCPVQRQTMLFSATMNTKVDDLIALSLKRPIRVRISDIKAKNDVEVAPRLEQEFVRVRAGNEGTNREAMLLALLTRTYTKHVIVFFDTKVTAHRIMILGGLLGIKCAELHGNLTQQQRLQALEDFRSGEVDVLLATDLAARGLDIDRVRTVINFEMPNQISTYIHRIGRTARAGRGGKSCTLIGEGRRHLMKELIKEAEAKQRNIKDKQMGSGVIRTRTIPQAVITHLSAKVDSLQSHVNEILEAEAVARMDRIADMEAMKAQNIIEHSEEIHARPQREWFVSETEKKRSKEAAAEKQRLISEKAGTGLHRMTRKKRRAREALKGLDAQDDAEDDRKPAVPNPGQIKSAIKKKKKENLEKEHEALKQSLHDIRMEREKRKEPKKKTGRDALGDASLFAEDKITFSTRKPKKETDVVQSAYKFRGYQPDKKLGKKKGVHKFKSKSKYKRK